MPEWTDSICDKTDISWNHISDIWQCRCHQSLFFIIKFEKYSECTKEDLVDRRSRRCYPDRPLPASGPSFNLELDRHPTRLNHCTKLTGTRKFLSHSAPATSHLMLLFIASVGNRLISFTWPLLSLTRDFLTQNLEEICVYQHHEVVLLED